VGFPFVLVLLMLRDFTSNFFSSSFGFCWCMGKISQKSFSWFCCLWDLTFDFSKSFYISIIVFVDVWGNNLMHGSLMSWRFFVHLWLC
jgi:hypothetical protein